MSGASAGTAARPRDLRRANWFWVQNVLIDVFQPVIGPLGVTVYNTLCREVRHDVVDRTLRELGELSTLSKDTVHRMVWKMRHLGMVGQTKTRRGSNGYELYDLEDAAGEGSVAECIARLRARLAAAEGAGRPKAPAKSRQESALDAATPSLFAEEAIVPVSPGDRVEASPEPLAETENCIEPVSVGDMEEADLSHSGETACLKKGGGLSQKEAVLSQIETPYLMIKKEKTETKTSTLLNPPVGRTSGESAQFVAGLLARLRRLKPQQGDVSDLCAQAAACLEAEGFLSTRAASIPDRGDGRSGAVELWGSKSGGDLREQVAIEIDGNLPREKSLTKLRRVDAFRVIMLRTGTIAGSYPGIDAVLALGWPGNGYESVTTPAKAEQQVRTMVGVAQGGVPSGNVAMAAPEPSAATVRQIFTTLREQVAVLAEQMGFHPEDEESANAILNPLAEFDGYFGTVAYERHEAEGAGKLLVLSSSDAAATVCGLKAYGERVRIEMTRTFGGVVQVQVVGVDTG